MGKREVCDLSRSMVSSCYRPAAMGLDSDVAIKLDKFDRGAVKQSTININKQLESAPSSSIKWWKVCITLLKRGKFSRCRY